MTVAMESTGVYWIPLFGVLEERGFEVMLVDPSRIKNVPGRKTDVLDCSGCSSCTPTGCCREASGRRVRYAACAVTCASEPCWWSMHEPLRNSGPSASRASPAEAGRAARPRGEEIIAPQTLAVNSLELYRTYQDKIASATGR